MGFSDVFTVTGLGEWCHVDLAGTPMCSVWKVFITYDPHIWLGSWTMYCIEWDDSSLKTEAHAPDLLASWKQSCGNPNALLTWWGACLSSFPRIWNTSPTSSLSIYILRSKTQLLAMKLPESQTLPVLNFSSPSSQDMPSHLTCKSKFMVVWASKDLSISMLAKFINLLRLDLEKLSLLWNFKRISSCVPLILLWL